MADWTAAEIKADATELRKAGENAVAAGPYSDAARAFRQEITDLYDRHGVAYVRSVFNQVKQDVGNVSVFSEAADGSNVDQLCFSHGVVRSAARLVNGQKDPIGLVCGYSTPMPQESFPVVEIPPNNYFGRRRERLP